MMRWLWVVVAVVGGLYANPYKKFADYKQSLLTNNQWQLEVVGTKAFIKKDISSTYYIQTTVYNPPFEDMVQLRTKDKDTLVCDIKFFFYAMPKDATSQACEGKCYIGWVQTQPPFLRKGCATALLTELKNMLIDAHYTCVSVQSYKYCYPLYQKLGFCMSHHDNLDTLRDKECVYMTCNLSSTE